MRRSAFVVDSIPDLAFACQKAGLEICQPAVAFGGKPAIFGRFPAGHHGGGLRLSGAAPCRRAEDGTGHLPVHHLPRGAADTGRHERDVPLRHLRKCRVRHRPVRAAGAGGHRRGAVPHLRRQGAGLRLSGGGTLRDGVRRQRHGEGAHAGLRRYLLPAEHHRHGAVHPVGGAAVRCHVRGGKYPSDCKRLQVWNFCAEQAAIRSAPCFFLRARIRR